MRRIVSAAALALPMTAALAANPLEWFGQKLLGPPKPKPPGVTELRDPGPVALKAGGGAVKFAIGDGSPEAELPKGRSHFRRVEVEGTVPHAHVRVTVIAQDAVEGKGHTVFKPLFYVLDGEGSVVTTLEPDPLSLDMRPFQRTRLHGCAKVENLQRFLIATGTGTKTAYESAARDAVKAPSTGGFYYATDAVKVKLPYAATGVVELKIVAADQDTEPCGAPPKKDGEKKDGDKKDGDKKDETKA